MVGASEGSTFSPASVASTRVEVSDEVKPDPSVGREKPSLCREPSQALPLSTSEHTYPSC